MAHYELVYRIIGSYITTVEADDYETAVKLGCNNYYDAELMYCKEE